MCVCVCVCARVCARVCEFSSDHLLHPKKTHTVIIRLISSVKAYNKRDLRKVNHL